MGEALIRRGFLLSLICLAVFSVAGSVEAATPPIVVNGSAAVIPGKFSPDPVPTIFRLRLTPDLVDQQGSAFFSNKRCNPNYFLTGFRFRMRGSAGSNGADGFALVIQDSPQGVNALGLPGFGGYLGYEGISRSVAIEFDTHYNPEYGDPNDNHVSIHTNGVGPNSSNEAFSVGMTTAIPDLNDGNDHHVIVVWFNGNLVVQLDGTTILTTPVDVPSILDGNGCAWFGYSAATGALSQNHDIYAWTWDGF